MLSYETAIGKVQKYIEKNTLITFPSGEKDYIAIFNWEKLTEESDANDDFGDDSLYGDRVVQIEVYHLNDEILKMMNSKKWGLFAVVGISGVFWRIEGFEDVAAAGALLFDFENGDEKNCPVISAFGVDSYRPVKIANCIEDLRISRED